MVHDEPVKEGSEQDGSSNPEAKFSFFVGPGNNSELVRKTLERRPWWELGKEDDPDLNLKWLQVRQRSVAEWVRRMGNKQYLNHLDGLTCIGRKNELYFNLKAYCEKEKINVHEIAPPTFVISVGEACPEYVEFCRVCKQLENKARGQGASEKSAKVVKSNEKAGKGEGATSSDNHSDNLSAASTDEPSSDSASRTASSSKNASKASLKSPGKSSHSKMSRGDAISNINTAGERNIWIVKPTNNNRGNGIRVFRGFNDVDAHLKKKQAGSQVIVQKYIERPLLYKGRKFDIRCLVLVDNNMSIYVYRRFYLRTSSAMYNPENVQDLFVHLTNYAVQKKKKKGKPERELDEDEMDEEDEAMEEGNNLSMDELTAFLAEEGYRMDANGILARIQEIVVLVFQAVWKKLNPLREKNTFEIFGWDFLLDEEMNVWLIEVNTNPYIGCSSQLLRTIFTGMLEGAVRKCIDPFFPPPRGRSLDEVEEVDGSDMWDKVYPAEPNKDKK